LLHSLADWTNANSIAVPGLATTTTAGGIYAQPTNIGSYDKSRFAVVPELAAAVSYQLTARLRAFAGYSVLFQFVFAGATLCPGKPARAMAACTNPEALAWSINSLM